MSKIDSKSDGFLLHAGAVQTPKGALVFPGPSGAGKSTICRRLSAKYTIIADDCLYAFRGANEQWYIEPGIRHMWRKAEYAVRWGFPSPFTSLSRSVQLCAIMPIRKTRNVAFVPLDSIAVCAIILPRFLEASDGLAVQNSIRIKENFERAAQLSRAARAWRLEIPNDDKILNRMEQFIEVLR